MKVLIIGANGYLGPHVVRALAPHHQLRITDIKPAPAEVRQKYAGHEFRDLDVTKGDDVIRAAEGMDAILNLSVLRPHRVLAFRVNNLGCYNVMRAAVQHGINRVINTGPHFTITGPNFEGPDHGITPEVPSQSGTYLYALTKSLGQEVCRIFTTRHDLYVMTFLFMQMRFHSKITRGAGSGPFAVARHDSGEVFRLGLDLDLAKLPSKSEIFFIMDDNPQGKFNNEKTKRILGFKPQRNVSDLWRKAR